MAAKEEVMRVFFKIASILTFLSLHIKMCGTVNAVPASAKLIRLYKKMFRNEIKRYPFCCLEKERFI